METLPNSITVFNSTPHTLTFWSEEWDAPVEVAPDEIVNARPIEQPIGGDNGRLQLVATRFVGDDSGRAVIARAKEAGADVIVGSIIAAQAYPGEVVACVPAPGYERVPAPLPREVMDALEETLPVGYPMAGQSLYRKYSDLPTKRMRPDKFTVFPAPIPATAPGKGKHDEHATRTLSAVRRVPRRNTRGTKGDGLHLPPADEKCGA